MSPCIRCGNVEAREASGYCVPCAVTSRLEVLAGMRKLSDYLAAWAAFDEWLRQRGSGPAAAA